MLSMIQEVEDEVGMQEETLFGELFNSWRAVVCFSCTNFLCTSHCAQSDLRRDSQRRARDCCETWDCSSKPEVDRWGRKENAWISTQTRNAN